ncbi:MAG: DUF2088 domain-containing protein [Desulfarculus sp.]|nr:MAG: DUF2088 domain-containing protein [Desulfarculus sp.]
MIAGQGSPGAALSAAQVRQIMAQGTPRELYAGRRVLVLTPDGTRTCPLPLLVQALREVVGPQAAKLDFMVALGTHPPLPQEKIQALYGLDAGARRGPWAGVELLNHRWDLADTSRRLGWLEEEEVFALSEGRLRERVPVDINRAVFNYDQIMILGPVFPHEVVGFSGGAKYLFPGVSTGEFLHFSHWLGAVITCAAIIGRKDTPVRRMLNRALEMVPVPVHGCCPVVSPQGQLCGLYAGPLQPAWSAAADLSARVHVVTKPRPYKVVLGRAPEMYDELWTAGKVMYKLEQVVADNGTLIIYGPHIKRVSRTWGEPIQRIGYHVRDYFLAEMARFADIPRGVLAHSTHVKGLGSFSRGQERPRIEVVLATGISPQECQRINLGYLDPAALRLGDFQGREDQGVLFVDRAGEVLYRLAG